MAADGAPLSTLLRRAKQLREVWGLDLVSLPGLEPVLLLLLVCNVLPMENEFVLQFNECLALLSSFANERLSGSLIQERTRWGI